MSVIQLHNKQQSQRLEMGWSELVDTLRDNFERKYAENIKKGVYDPRDVDRVRNDFRFARSFIRGRERLEEGADLIHTSLTFKNEWKVHDVTEDMFSEEMRQLGALYFRARDINGSRILWLNVRLHRKDAPTEYLNKEKLGIASGLEKALNEECLKPVVVVLDMTGCGLVNMDIDFVKFIITCFKFYYPTFLDYMLIYDMPWIFNAAWKIVKAWLSAEAASKIKFVTKNNVKEYINADSLPKHMGGNDDFKFVYTPGMSLEPLYPPEDKDEKKVTFEAAATEVKEEAVTQTEASSDTHAAPLPVPHPQHFGNNVTPKHPPAAVHTSNSNNSSSTAISAVPPAAISIHSAGSGSSSSVRHRNSVSNANNNNNDKSKSFIPRKSSTNNTFVGKYVSVSPADQLSFYVDSTGDAFDVITLSNTLPLAVAFKVKTTSPEKYRVRPSSGIVQPGKTDEVFVYLTEEHKSTTTAKDKFLIMAMEVSGPAVEDSAKLWKDVPKDSIMEHRLKCVTVSKTKDLPVTSASNADSFRTNVPPSPMKLEDKVDQLERQNVQIQKQLNMLIILQISTAIFFVIIMLSFSCFGEDLFSRYLRLPFGFCSDSYGRK